VQRHQVVLVSEGGLRELFGNVHFRLPQNDARLNTFLAAFSAASMVASGSSKVSGASASGTAP